MLTSAVYVCTYMVLVLCMPLLYVCMPLYVVLYMHLHADRWATMPRVAAAPCLLRGISGGAASRALPSKNGSAVVLPGWIDCLCLKPCTAIL